MKKGQHKLTDDQVRDIYNDRRYAKIIAAEYHVSDSLVSGIRNGSRYGDITSAHRSELVTKVELLIDSAKGPTETEKLARKIISLVTEDCRRRLG